jgi:ubiquinone/menaquinone biosynthesis C-methylase UbiE
MVFIRNNGTDFPGVPDASIDFLFSFGVFVHLDIDIIDKYLDEMARVLKPSATAVIQYSDMNKEKARRNVGFSQNRPEVMVPLVESKGYRVLDDERSLMNHSSIVRFSPAV